MSLVVTGLGAVSASTALRAALRAAGVPDDGLTVVGDDDSAPTFASSDTRFVSTAADAAIGSDEILTSTDGDFVPDGDRSRDGVGGPGSVADRLLDLQIPATYVDDYAAAIDNGQTLFAYRGSADDVARAEAVFRSAGLARIHR